MNEDLLSALDSIEKERGINKETLFEAIEVALISAYKRNFNHATNARVEIDRETGKFKVLRCYEVVEEVNNDSLEINKDQASEINYNSSKIKQLTNRIKAKNACSACYGSLLHALKRIEEKGKLNQINKTLYIGQAYQNKELKGLGIGSCCSQAVEFLNGCPPSAKEIIDFLTSQEM